MTANVPVTLAGAVSEADGGANAVQMIAQDPEHVLTLLESSDRSYSAIPCAVVR
jgi:hypothetical protein